MKVLSISTMFPVPPMEQFGIFVYRRLAAVAEKIDLTIVNPIPYFPGAALHAKYCYRKHIPSSTTKKGITIYHPRYFSIPGTCKPLDGFTVYNSIKTVLNAKGPFDLIDAQLAFPDGFAAALVKREFKIPYAVTLRGHDINVLPELPLRGKMVRFVLQNADRVMSVAKALGDRAIELGCNSSKISTIPNGVEHSIFKPLEKRSSQLNLELDPNFRYLLSVGHLIERKGHHLVIECLAKLKQQGHTDLKLLIVGSKSIEGNFYNQILDIIRTNGLSDSVRLVGDVDQNSLPLWYSSSECLCLASSMEGWANVLLESLACGRPVVATNVWGTPEVIFNKINGFLVDRNIQSISAGINECLNYNWNEEKLNQFSSNYTWESTASKVIHNYNLAIGYQDEYQAHA